MIKKVKAVTCDFCKQSAIMVETGCMDSTWWELPEGWKEAGKKTHYCPACAAAIQIARKNILKKGNEKDV